MNEYAFFWLMLFASVVAMVVRFIKLPYTIALVLAGLLVGQVGLLPGVHLEPHILFAVFLPPLLFEAGINIHIKPLAKNWAIILVLAIFGTVASTFLIGYAVSWLVGIPLMVALLFGAIISPTDPISVLAMFKQMGVDERLSLVVEAESLFNDGVAVVLFGVLQGILLTGNFSLTQAGTSFVVNILGGSAIGVAIGWVGSKATMYFEDHLLEITMTTIVAYGAYIGAESLHVSGVISVVAASLVVGNLGIPKGMTESSQSAVLSFWEYAAFAVNSMVFLIIGIEMARTPLHTSVSTVALVVAVVVLARAVSVYGISTLMQLSPKTVLPRAWQHVLVWGGLRGALSMAMVLGLSTTMPNQRLLVTLTFGVVLFSTFGQGLTIERLVKRLGLLQK